MNLRSTIGPITTRPPTSAVARRLEPAAIAVRNLHTLTRRASGDVEMPWIWNALRDQVYSRMPTYEDRNDLKVVLAPVVVTSPGDTVPGLGIAGDF